MTVDVLLSRLRNVRPTGRGKWIASSPTREDKHPSLAIRELQDGRILVHDFGGSSAQEILDAVGLAISDLFPQKEIHYCKPERRPFPAADVLQCLAFEALIVATTGRKLLQGNLSDTDRSRLMKAVGRIEAATQYGAGL
jgi:hypothetical protein